MNAVAKVERNRPLTEDERVVFSALAGAAECGKACPTNEELLGLLPERNSLSGIVKIMHRLETWGLITVDRYQRTRQVTIAGSQRSTGDPSNKAPHWRTRPREMPSPSVVAMQQRQPSVATAIFAEAKRLGKSPQDFLCDLTWEGWQVHQHRDSPGMIEALRKAG